MENMVYEDLLKAYDSLNEEVKEALLIYKSKLFYFINEIATIPNFEVEDAYNILSKIKDKDAFIYKFESYKELVNLPVNMFIKKSIFASINFDTIIDFIDSLKKVLQILEHTTLTLPNDITVYRIVSVEENKLEEISKSNIISTTINPDILDQFIIHPYNHLYKIHVKAGAKVLVTPYSIIMNLENERLSVKKDYFGQQEVIVFKNSLEIEQTECKEKNMEDGYLWVHTIDAYPKEYGKKL